MSAVRPGYASGFSPTRSSQRNVRDSPSNDTDERTSRTKTARLTVRASVRSSLSAGNVSSIAGRASAPGARLPGAAAPSGASQDTMRKNTENGSAFASHRSPKASTPASWKRR